MRSDRRPAQLIAAVVALVAGAAASAVPLARHGVSPALIDLAVGWALVAGGVVIVGASPIVAALLSLGGVVWIAVGLAPFAGAPLDALLERLALAPTALLATAANVLPDGRPASRRGGAGAAVALSAAVVAGGGWYRFAVLAIGLAVLAGVDVAASTAARRRANRVRGGVAAGLIAVGLLLAWSGPARPRQVANLFDLVIIAGTVATVWCVQRSAALRLSGPVVVDQPASLGAALGQAFGTGSVRLAFPTSGGVPRAGWIDLAGAGVDMPVIGSPWCNAAGTIVAWAVPPIPAEVASGDSITRLLDAAGDTARLRAALRQHAAEIEESRVRLRYAAEVERSRLIQLFDEGPLASIRTAQQRLSTISAGQALIDRAATATETLRAVVGGLDPVAAGGGLARSLERLIEGPSATASIDPELQLSSEQERAVWFCCAEALANSAKHAAGAQVEVSLLRCHDGVELIVRDEGPGGADPNGSGLSGLQERARGVGGNLTIESMTGAGTCVRLTLPAEGEARQRVADAELTPMRSTGCIASVRP